MNNPLWRSLLAWYAQQRRDLPWRHTRDPYAILVSEAMLQQTGVERVILKYAAFLDRFPTLRALAEAPTGDVIRLWQGLGYNRRAVWLHRAAQQAIARWGGLPSAVDDLLSLPGVGPYTARAVACFAYGAEVAVVDTNVRRVLTRVLHGAEETALTPSQMLSLAGEVLPPGRAYDWNQALMDLGATTCTHDKPLCLICPLQAHCQAFPSIRTAPPALPVALGEPRSRWKEEPFVGSRRYYRGRIVERLRALTGGETMELSTLGSSIKSDYGEADADWLRGLVDDLATDGLLRVAHDGRVGLP
jgi:A/G-specific adenine glycosylase